jgi:hypothetical protein
MTTTWIYGTDNNNNNIIFSRITTKSWVRYIRTERYITPASEILHQYLYLVVVPSLKHLGLAVLGHLSLELGTPSPSASWVALHELILGSQ